MNLLIIGDPHAHPDYDNDRFFHLGNFIIRNQPDYIVCLGDFADMPSLSSYDRGTRGFEGRRYRNDVIAALDAQDILFHPLKVRQLSAWTKYFDVRNPTHLTSDSF